MLKSRLYVEFVIAHINLFSDVITLFLRLFIDVLRITSYMRQHMNKYIYRERKSHYLPPVWSIPMSIIDYILHIPLPPVYLPEEPEYLRATVDCISISRHIMCKKDLPALQKWLAVNPFCLSTHDITCNSRGGVKAWRRSYTWRSQSMAEIIHVAGS
jgi:hypothetical protein